MYKYQPCILTYALLFCIECISLTKVFRVIDFSRGHAVHPDEEMYGSTLE